MARGTGSAVPFVGGGGRGHGTAVARVVALGGGGGGWGWQMRIRNAGNGKRGSLRGGRGTPTRNGSGARCGAPGSGGGGSRALGSPGSASGSESSASERLRRGSAGKSGRADGASVMRGGGGGSAAVCRIGPRRGVSRATRQVFLGSGGLRVVPPGTRGEEEVPDPPWICRVGVLCRVRWMRRRLRQVVRVQWFFGGAVPDGVGLGRPLWRRRGGRADTVLGRGAGGPWW